MKLFRTTARKPAAPVRAICRLETLEDRAVPAALSIGSASAIEGATAYRFTDDFVAPDAYGLAAARNVQVGPDGNVYVASHDTDVVKVFEGGTGRFLHDLSTSGGEMDGPWGLIFGPDGRLYAGGRYSLNVIRFDITTGGYDVFVSAANNGGLNSTNSNSLAFGPDGNLYISSLNSVKRYSGTTGAYLGDFVAAGSGGLNNAYGVAFGPDGNLYVASQGTQDVKRYNGQTGAPIDSFVAPGSGGLTTPTNLFFRDGYLYVGDSTNLTAKVLRYNATTGAYVDLFASSNTSGAGASGLAFGPSGEFYLSNGTPTLQPGSAVLRFAPASIAAFTVSLDAAATSPMTVNFATADGTANAGSDYVATSGTLAFAPGQTSRTILVPTVNDNTAEPTETFSVTLSNPTGATIATAVGTGTIKDDDTTQFFVVDDAAADRDYQYGLLGKATGNTGLADTAPRGAASTAAGTKVWVADANKTVYVYSTAGGLLGSWAALDLPKNASVEGIATNGTDVWVLANSTGKDQVYKYAGAASRLSGSQGATSTFRLNSADANPKGIVTDGTSLWVVDDGTSADRVFKYTLAGGFLGSWTIDAANAHPTGLTIDPTDVSDIWVVDNGTDRVYQYTAAVGRTSGSQSAAATFALAAGNTNPQDIADPPPADAIVSFTLTSADQNSVPTAAPALVSFSSARGIDWMWLQSRTDDFSRSAPRSATGKVEHADELVPLAWPPHAVPLPLEASRGQIRGASVVDVKWKWLDASLAASADDLTKAEPA